MKKKSKTPAWLRAVLFVPVVLVAVALFLIFPSHSPRGVTFKTVSLPRFEISIATLPDGSQVRIMFDRATGRDYLINVSARGGVSTISLPFKDQN